MVKIERGSYCDTVRMKIFFWIICLGVVYTGCLLCFGKPRDGSVEMDTLLRKHC